MFDTTGITGELKMKLWTETIMTIIDWYNISIRTEEKRCPDKICNDKIIWTRELRVFGEIWIIKKIGKQKIEHKRYRWNNTWLWDRDW